MEYIFGFDKCIFVIGLKATPQLVIEPKKEVMTRDGLALSLLPSSIVMLLPLRWHCSFTQKNICSL